MNRETFLDMADKYIDGTMSSAERYNFEQMINENLELKKEFELLKAIRTGIALQARRKFKDELLDIKKEFEKENKEGRSSLLNKILLVGALIVGAIGIVFLVNSDFAGSKTQKTDGSEIENTEKGRSKSSLIYAGQFDVKTLPLAGKLGGTMTEKTEIVISPDDSEMYFYKNDTLWILTHLTSEQLFGHTNINIIINQDRDLIIQNRIESYRFKVQK